MSTCHARFAVHAARAPHRVAVTDGATELTYGELDRRSDRLARALVAAGVGPDVLVGVSAAPSADLVVAILGIHKAGGAYVPLDPAYPPARLAYVVRDSGLRHLVCGQGGWDGAGPGVQVVRLDADLPDAPDVVPAEGRLAYVIYTSGSTGQPKGVLVTHDNVARLFTATRHWFGFTEDDVWTLFHSFAFDFSVWELWGALAHGGRLVVVPHAVRRAPGRFLDLLRRERVTVLNQTPSAFALLAGHDHGQAADLALRYVIFGGEALDPATLAPWVRRHGTDRPRLVNMYGITETTVHVTHHVIGAADLTGGGRNIGAPIPDLTVHLVDRARRLVPDGEVGEICVAGPGVASGYLNRPDLDAARFTALPDLPGVRVYRSGDLARRRPGGDLEYLGRLDHQVKIRGHRVEPGEVEAALAEHPDVGGALVLAEPDHAGDTILAAYVTPSGRPPDRAALYAHLCARLPAHLVPQAFTVLSAFPLTANGKIDRDAVTSASTVAAAPDTAPDTATHTPPGGDVADVLAAVWSEVLGVATVGPDDNYFVLGGDSIRAVRILDRARALGVDLTLEDLLTHQTVRALSGVLTRA